MITTSTVSRTSSPAIVLRTSLVRPPDAIVIFGRSNSENVESRFSSMTSLMSAKLAIAKSSCVMIASPVFFSSAFFAVAIIITPS